MEATKPVEAAKAAAEYCLFWCDSWWLCLTKDEWASWVQAIGTVAAVLASGLFVWWENHQRRMDAIRAGAALLAARAQLVDLMHGSLVAYLRNYSDAGVEDVEELERSHNRMRGAIGDVVRIDLAEMPTYEAVLDMRNLQEMGKLVFQKMPPNPMGWLEAPAVEELELWRSRMSAQRDSLWAEAQKLGGGRSNQEDTPSGTTPDT